MKAVLVSFVCLMVHITNAQMPNGNFNYTCYQPASNTSYFFDAFYKDPVTGNCGLDPWRISHGTPDIRRILPQFESVPFSFHASVSGGRNFGQTANWGSEGIFQNYNFYKGNRYYLRAFVKGYHVNDGENFDIDRVFIALTNGLAAKNVPFNQNTDYNFPSNNRQDIWFENNFKSDWKLVEKEFIPNADYSQLWISLTDDDGDQQLRQNADFFIGGIYIACCPYDKLIDNSNPNPEIPNMVIDGSIIAGNKIQTIGSISVLINSGQAPTLQAGKEVVLGAGFVGGAGFRAVTGVSCDCALGAGNVVDICSVFSGGISYIGNTTGPGVYVPNYFDRDRYANWYPISYGYSKPYNAYFWKLKILNRWGATVYEAENTSDVSGFLNQTITWNGGDVSAGTYYVNLNLTNCTSTYTYNGWLQVAGTAHPNSVAAVSTNSSSARLVQPDESKIQSSEMPDKTQFEDIYPNPADKMIELKYSIAVSGSTRIILIDEQGKARKGILLEDFHPAGNFKFSYSVENFPPGIYHVLFESGAIREVKKLIIIR
jgi:uncharacterized membrane protein